MKKTLFNIFTLILIYSCFSTQSFALTKRYCSSSQIDSALLLDGGDGVVYPWGEETLFPWNSVQGFWTTDGHNDCPHYFFFKMLKDHYNKKYLKITKYNPNTCKILAIGFAYPDKKGKIAEGKLNQLTHEQLQISVHVFNDVERSQSIYNENNDILVVNFKELETNNRDNAYALRRLDLKSKKVCSPLIN